MRKPPSFFLFFAPSREDSGSFFLGLRWLDTALDFPIDALYSHPKLRQAGALQDTLIPTKRLGQLHNVG
jgi:hypothetical protein